MTTDHADLTDAVWSDGDPLMEAIAAAVYEQCETHPEQSLTVDDPRNIAAVAATVARRVLGTPTTNTETETEAEAPTEEQIVREHVTTVHLIGEQLEAVESWLWERLADIRAAEAQQPAPAETEEPTP